MKNILKYCLVLPIIFCVIFTVISLFSIILLDNFNPYIIGLASFIALMCVITLKPIKSYFNNSMSGLKTIVLVILSLAFILIMSPVISNYHINKYLKNNPELIIE